MRPYTIAIMIAALCAACGGDATQQAQDEPETVQTVHDAGPDDEPREIPRCAGAHEPEPGDCQRLVYGSPGVPGYCNRWLPCVALLTDGGAP